MNKAINRAIIRRPNSALFQKETKGPQRVSETNNEMALRYYCTIRPISRNRPDNTLERPAYLQPNLTL